MMNDTYLYTRSAEEARKRDELSLWRASHRENIACKEAIEEAVRHHFDGSRLANDCLNEVLRKFGCKRTAWVLANTLQQLEWDGRFSPRNKAWAKEFLLPSDKRHNLEFVVNSHPVVLDGVVDFYRKAYQALDLFGPDQCEPESRPSLNYEGRVLVLSPEALNEHHWSPRDQLWYALDGFGCSPTSLGQSIRCTCLGDGEMTRWNRADFLGVLKPEHLPDWARDRLRELTVETVPKLDRLAKERRLAEKIAAAWESYEKSLQDLSPQELIDRAKEIAAVRTCRDSLLREPELYSEEQLDLLLSLPDPLALLQDRQMEEQEMDSTEQISAAIRSLREAQRERQDLEPPDQSGMTMT